ncbi:isopenicillin N synthase family dioxygenase [Polymorphobacter fuscus]|uniref:2-oxoglutarate-dependent ethylene/succinate-forming enzyme n=1 Tax=Sandarakinorhabdus fusca TaxID=1439888 RepID=A0A7C9LEG9_9SPHN|nr:2-oxoglutarate and iron-dependent oxygenase domain-containing protein [Polymorphobacter fuscus]KAB7648391.1 isopenicillin N synthase family oxygenase [Polymorphobacter fuscus]MQT15907.1 isopenicillin N synthase family oxygenase [Polymorphobacter fuscus]NJC07818.1 isopenicillin N synthase-like dioxygenase [Polymorphobacter fuscus]
MTIADIQPIRLSLVDTDLPAAAAAFGDAFRRTGFAVVADHGIPQSLIDRALIATRALFALPAATKARYVIPGGGGQRGMTAFGIEAAKGAARADLKEFWHVGRDLPAGHRFSATMPPNIWPDEVPDFHAAVGALYAALDAAGRRMLRAIAVHLQRAPDFFDEPVAEGNSILRLLHYPPVQIAEAGAIRAGAHEDINVITLLLGAEEAGLQLLSPDGTWHDIAAPQGSLVCNIGDMLQRLTGGRLPSTTHRVVNPVPERAAFPRYSTPFFLHFRPDYRIETMPGGPLTAPPITADAYLHERLREIKLL